MTDKIDKFISEPVMMASYGMSPGLSQWITEAQKILRIYHEEITASITDLSHGCPADVIIDSLRKALKDAEEVLG